MEMSWTRESIFRCRRGQFYDKQTIACGVYGGGGTTETPEGFLYVYTREKGNLKQCHKVQRRECSRYRKT